MKILRSGDLACTLIFTLYVLDNNVMEVVLNGQPTWKYEYDANNNIIKINQYDDTKILTISQNNQIESNDGER